MEDYFPDMNLCWVRILISFHHISILPEQPSNREVFLSILQRLNFRMDCSLLQCLSSVTTSSSFKCFPPLFSKLPLRCAFPFPYPFCLSQNCPLPVSFQYLHHLSAFSGLFSKLGLLISCSLTPDYFYFTLGFFFEHFASINPHIHSTIPQLCIQSQWCLQRLLWHMKHRSLIDHTGTSEWNGNISRYSNMIIYMVKLLNTGMILTVLLSSLPRNTVRYLSWLGRRLPFLWDWIY